MKYFFEEREFLGFPHCVLYTHLQHLRCIFSPYDFAMIRIHFQISRFHIFFASFRWKNDPEHHAEGVVPPPQDPNAPGELGKPVKFDNPEPEVKALIDEGWKNNAFNQYASDVISLHRSLPDPRDSW